MHCMLCYKDAMNIHYVSNLLLFCFHYDVIKFQINIMQRRIILNLKFHYIVMKTEEEELRNIMNVSLLAKTEHAMQ